MGKYFGTDGIRGVANETLDAKMAYRVGCAAATVLLEQLGARPLVLIGKDTRISSDMLEAALIAGICSAGADAMPLGVMPTPAVAYLTVAMKAGMGVVISASHNPFEHNGIKIFDESGFKLSDELEERIERMVDGVEPCLKQTRGKIGRIVADGGRGAEMYIDFLARAAAADLKGMRIAVDCANGAAAMTAGRLFSRLGVEYTLINASPNGININENCGSTHIGCLQEAVKAGNFDAGLAFDGDADRCLVVDESGDVVDGDKMMAIIGCHMKENGALKNNAVVATVMSNVGFHEYMKKAGISVMCAAVGDRNVLEMMVKQGCNLGGEQSGHIIFLDDATTGDGQLAAVKFLSVVRQRGKAVSELAGAVPQYPQVLMNAPVTGGNGAKDAVMRSEKLMAAVEREERALGGAGRILVRPSGTESLIRVMVEAKTRELATAAASRIVELIKSL